MKKSLILLNILAIGNFMIMFSCEKIAAVDRSNPADAPLGTVTTLAGPSFPVAGGSPLSASFKQPYGVAVDDSGNVYVADFGNNLIRKISSSGLVTTLAGSGNAGSSNGIGAAASFNSPIGLAVDRIGNVYVADYGNQMIRMISPSGMVTTLAGTGTKGSANGAGNTSTFNEPTGIAVDNSLTINSGTIYIADQGNNMIRMIDTYGSVSTLAGTGARGSANGAANASTFNKPTGVAADNLGNVYVADGSNNMIRKINPSGVVSTLAGTGAVGSANGAGATASFTSPFGVTADASGNVYVADQGNNLIRVINSSGVVSTLAGSGALGAQNGMGSSASFDLPSAVAVDKSGNVYVADFDNNLIRVVNPSGIVGTLAGSGQAGSANPGTTASFSGPTGTAVDAQGNVYVVDQSNNVIRKIDPNGVVSTLAGNGNSSSIDGPDSVASFFLPFGIAIDQNGNLYVSELANKIRMISPSGMVSTLAGSGALGSANGAGSAASFSQPAGVAVDNMGNVYVADLGNNLIRKISASGVVSTLAGSGFAGFNNGSYPPPSFNSPIGVAVDDSGNVYVADAGNNMIRKISPSGNTSTFAGNGTAGSLDGAGNAAYFDNPTGIAVDNEGNVYVTDYSGNMIRQIAPNASVLTLAGNGIAGSANGRGAAATFNKPTGIAVDRHQIMYVADKGNNLIRMVVQLP
jgi:sugar lactone lactonase YvrE